VDLVKILFDRDRYFGLENFPGLLGHSMFVCYNFVLFIVGNVLTVWNMLIVDRHGNSLTAKGEKNTVGRISYQSCILVFP